MARICCLAGLDHAEVTRIAAVLKRAGETTTAVESPLEVRPLGRIRPDLLIADIDGVDSDPLELLRQIRFVLPSCVIAIYSGESARTWGVACHTAGANALLWKNSSETELSAGIEDVLASGCYTDPHFVA